ncbi:MAG: C39 family peptidase [Chloroflexota bacterium]
MTQRKLLIIAGIVVGAAFLAVMLYQIPYIHQRAAWRLDLAYTYLRGVVYPADAVPTPKPVTAVPVEALNPSPTVTATATVTSTQVLEITSTPAPSPTPIPEKVDLPYYGWEQQDWNNCGPAALSMYLNFYGWEGNQFDISNVIKPTRGDRNVNIEELAHFSRNYAGWLETQYRVGGDLELLKQLLAAGIPVMIESSFYFGGPYWPNDDLWAAHYLLVTGYDSEAGTFTVQDTYRGPNQTLKAGTLDENWQSFNRVFVLIYLPAQKESVLDILGPLWDDTYSHQRAMEMAEAEIATDPEDAFAWFNLGSNHVYFEQYEQAAQAYDQARQAGLPQRMMRYQFGPFLAYFHSDRIDELVSLSKYTLQRTPNSEEALLWHGWGLYRQGDFNGAVADFRAALEANYLYTDAQYALDFVLGQ